MKAHKTKYEKLFDHKCNAPVAQTISPPKKHAIYCRQRIQNSLRSLYDICVVQCITGLLPGLSPKSFSAQQ